MWRTYFSASWGPDNCTRLAMSCNDNVKNVWNLESTKPLKLDVKNFPYQSFMAYAILFLKSDGKKQVERIVITYKSIMRVESVPSPKALICYCACMQAKPMESLLHFCNSFFPQTVLTMSNLFPHLFTWIRWLSIPWISFKRCMYYIHLKLVLLQQTFELAKKELSLDHL